ncbi:MAG TPA: LysR substrate-binding domain-containing protein [Stellaceae bacterium]|nr:LysR substrate-binding domain-containing protein [Stellaceae bacterium]
MRKLPPLTALRAFEAAARHQSFKTAAHELAVTPTAISHQVRLLEEMLERPLFRRRPRPLLLTEAGAALFPVARDSLDALAGAVEVVRGEVARPKLRVTTTNAFAGRWLVPRLTLWRAAHPEIMLEVIGTDAVIELATGPADIAIRYAFAPPPGLISTELLRDRFWPVASPQLLATGIPIKRPSDLAQYPFVDAFWAERNVHAPTWQRWVAMAQGVDDKVSSAMAADALAFSEELHAIDAVIAGQGIGLFSDVLIAPELTSGKLVKLLDLALPGLGFYLAYARDHPRKAINDAFCQWICSVR